VSLDFLNKSSLQHRQDILASVANTIRFCSLSRVLLSSGHARLVTLASALHSPWNVGLVVVLDTLDYHEYGRHQVSTLSSLSHPKPSSSLLHDRDVS